MFTLDFEYTLNGKETVPKRGSNVFLKSRIFKKFNLIGHKYWTLSLILSGMLFFTWYYLNSLKQKEFYFVNLEPTNILPCFAHMSWRQLSSLSLVKTKKARPSENDIPFFCEVKYIAKSCGVGRKSVTHTPTHSIPYSEI